MTESSPAPTVEPSSRWAPVLVAAGSIYLGLGGILAVVFLFGGIESSLFPTGWLFPAVLLVSGGLMAARRRFDIVVTLWGSLTLAVFLLGVLVYVNALDRGLDDAAAFDATLIVAAFGFGALLLRPAFRD